MQKHVKTLLNSGRTVSQTPRNSAKRETGRSFIGVAGRVAILGGGVGPSKTYTRLQRKNHIIMQNTLKRKTTL